MLYGRGEGKSSSRRVLDREAEWSAKWSAKWLSRQHFDDSWNVRFSAALLLEACTRNVTCLRIGYVEVELISKCYITAFPIATSRNSSERMWIYDVLLVKGFECILSLRLLPSFRWLNVVAEPGVENNRCMTWSQKLVR